MRIASIQTLSPSSLPTSLPMRLEQKGSTLNAAAMLAIAVPSILLVLVPCLVLAVAAVAEPATRDAAAVNPAAIVQIAFGLVLWAALFGIPARRALEQLGQRRIVILNGHEIAVTDRTLLGVTTHKMPLSRYLGLAHHVRTSVSGTRHELVLVHPDPASCVLLAMADRIGKQETEALANLLGLPELPARSLYGSNRLLRPMQRRPRRAALPALAAGFAMPAGIKAA
ncbi:MAG: hypothetical protein NW217_12035 [Hyphomicrobiaceae bacterium]|nr:hypothetical protein [Hyphomicrobiaceae bacterium]